MDESLKSKGYIQPGLYNITKADGSPVDPRADYFVLRLDEHGSDPLHAKACRAAILTYAENIRPHLPLLAKDLEEKYALHIDEQEWKDAVYALCKGLHISLSAIDELIARGVNEGRSVQEQKRALIGMSKLIQHG